MAALDSSQIAIGVICAVLAVAAYIGYKIVKSTIMLFLAGVLALAALGGGGYFFLT